MATAFPDLKTVIVLPEIYTHSVLKFVERASINKPLKPAIK